MNYYLIGSGELQDLSCKIGPNAYFVEMLGRSDYQPTTAAKAPTMMLAFFSKTLTSIGIF